MPLEQPVIRMVRGVDDIVASVRDGGDYANIIIDFGECYLQIFVDVSTHASMDSAQTIPMSEREQQLRQWLGTELGREFLLAPASDDASFRRYFRVTLDNGSTRVVMDAPPERENTEPFMRISARLAAAGVHVPRVLAADRERGFLLLTDLGDRQYADALNDDSVDALYGDALDTLMLIQGISDTSGLPAYDSELLQRELEIFREWLLAAWLDLHLSPAEQDTLDESFALLVDNALEQPRVFVHRDYHSRNLMVCTPGHPGVLDFQDAVVGPVSYDLVSLLRDCYVAWPEQRVQGWCRQAWQRMREAGRIDCDLARFQRWFDLMGMQRHLKAAGIFCRLKLRDGKDGYIKDIPRTLNYVVQVADADPRLQAFAALLRQRVLPAFAKEADR